MRTFISWSGTQSQQLAQAFRDWLPLVLHYVDPWMSASDIDAGDRWGTKIAKELDTTNFGIICVTKENLNANWMLFEAGALAKSVEDGRVIPLLLDIDFKEISGPLAQFQAKKTEKKDIQEIVTSINKNASTPVLDDRLKQLFESLWPSLETKISAIPKKSTPSKQARSQNDILEELVSSIRNLEMRFRDSMDDPRGIIKRRPRLNIHPGMLMELAKKISDGPRDPIAILIFSSLLRDDVPWLYELGLDAYRSIKSGRPKEARASVQRFIEAVNMLRHGPFMEMFDDKRTYMVIREMLSMMDLPYINCDDLDPPTNE